MKGVMESLWIYQKHSTPFNHDLLIAKLHAYGFDNNSFSPVKSYLTDKWQRTKINYYYLIIYKAPKSTNANVQRRILYIHYSPISLLEKVRLQFPFENFNRFG